MLRAWQATSRHWWRPKQGYLWTPSDAELLSCLILPSGCLHYVSPSSCCAPNCWIMLEVLLRCLSACTSPCELTVQCASCIDVLVWPAPAVAGNSSTCLQVLFLQSEACRCHKARAVCFSSCGKSVAACWHVYIRCKFV